MLTRHTSFSEAYRAIAVDLDPTDARKKPPLTDG
jgi:hypothetical protein